MSLRRIVTGFSTVYDQLLEHFYWQNKNNIKWYWQLSLFNEAKVVLKGFPVPGIWAFLWQMDRDGYLEECGAQLGYPNEFIYRVTDKLINSFRSRGF